jgi:hypothetical protein
LSQVSEGLILQIIRFCFCEIICHTIALSHRLEFNDRISRLYNVPVRYGILSGLVHDYACTGGASIVIISDCCLLNEFLIVKYM